MAATATAAMADEQRAPWEGIEAEENEGGDELLQSAIDLVRQHQQASASFLQRHMRIGYPRAARLIDELEELGVVGPPRAAADPGRSSMTAMTNQRPSPWMISSATKTSKQRQPDSSPAPL